MTGPQTSPRGNSEDRLRSIDVTLVADQFRTGNPFSFSTSKPEWSTPDKIRTEVNPVFPPSPPRSSPGLLSDSWVWGRPVTRQSTPGAPVTLPSSPGRTLSPRNWEGLVSILSVVFELMQLRGLQSFVKDTVKTLESPGPEPLGPLVRGEDTSATRVTGHKEKVRHHSRVSNHFSTEVPTFPLTPESYRREGPRHESRLPRLLSGARPCPGRGGWGTPTRHRGSRLTDPVPTHPPSYLLVLPTTPGSGVRDSSGYGGD